MGFEAAVKALMETTDKLLSIHQNNLDMSVGAAVRAVNADSVTERGTTQENNKTSPQPTVFDYLVKLQSGTVFVFNSNSFYQQGPPRSQNLRRCFDVARRRYRPPSAYADPLLRRLLQSPP